ncbi:hypothetical protein ACHAWO_000988 [Cyclotella atomus]|uniref:protein-serine/threonine phosphatase n=1 Tax=Cyclotella atomus TaxID=382360 RepID=A0ABD3QM76_9STRA
MGNATSINNDESSIHSRFSTSSTSSSNSHSSNPLLQRRVSSFLEEPICIKHTERGSAPLQIPAASKFKIKSSKIRTDKLRFAVSEMQGWRSHMEDKHCINPPLTSSDINSTDSSSNNNALLSDHYLFAIFDGHGGTFTSYYCGENLIKTLTSRPEWKAYLNLPKASRGDVQGIKLLKRSLSSTFLALDTQIEQAQRQKRLSQLDELQSILSQDLDSVPEEYQTLFQTGSDDNMAVQAFAKPNPASVPSNVNLERSGSTGVVVLITPTHILCANAGDSRALLCRSGAALPLSFDHKPNNDSEAARIDSIGGFVRGGRVNGDLAVSRSFGDFSYKSKVFRGPKLQEVTVDPDIIVHPREYEKDEFIVLACDGVWDRLTNRDVATLVRTCIDEGENDVGLVCEEIIDTALEMDSRDNMTAAVVMFPGAKMSRSYSENMGVDVVVPDEIVGVRKRRMERERKWGPNSTVAGRAQKRLEDRKKKSGKSLLDMQRLRAVQQQQQLNANKASSEIKTATTANKISGTKHTVPAKGHASKVMKKNAVRTTTTSRNSGLQVQ